MAEGRKQDSDRSSGDATGGPEENELTIEQLAHETGMSVRNIRNHQSRGLLPPPEVRARTGYYGRRHVERLRLIQEMQAEGLKLTAIKGLLGEEGSWAERFVGLRRAISAPWESEQAEIVTVTDLERRFGPRDEKALDRAIKLGLLVPVGDDRFEAPSPTLLRAAEDVVERGVPLRAALSAIEKVRRHVEGAARALVKLYLEELWKPFEEAGGPPERWDEITDSIEHLRPLAAEVMLALFRQTMATEAEDAFGKILADHGGKRR